ncbi:MAG: L-2-amino-thiazoline-4-carboxylic acid hydrolase [Bacteroidales bacterium]|nr:L-2-amino-thiazoline-4-carboxylic acid hydrolase [Bacteroidales bacterium]
MNKSFTAKSMMADSRFSALFKTLPDDKLRDIESRVEQLIRDEQEFCVPISRPHLCNLFCALAIYQSDLAEGIDAETSQQKIVNVMETYLIPRKRMFQRMAKLPGVFPLLRKLIPKMMMKGNGHGWYSVELDLGKDVCAFDTRQCIFATIFKKRGVPELGPCFCRIDEYLYSELPGIKFTRTGTCCRGDECCDFRFERINK